MQEAEGTVKNTRKVSWWRKALLYVGCFFAVFELTAQLGFELRPHSIYPPLAWVAGPPPLQNRFAHRTSELGNPSAIYRGEKRRWAIAGTSWTDGIGIPQSEVWPAILQSRFAKDDVHIANFSGMNTSVLHILRYLESSGQHFDKIFIALDGLNEAVRDSADWAWSFPHSRAWLALPSRILLSELTLEQLWLDSDFRNTVRDARFFISRRTGTRFMQPFAGDSQAFEACYTQMLRERGCGGLFKKRRLQESSVDPWAIWREQYLVCQMAVDRECGVPSRLDEMSFEENRIQRWERTVGEFIRLGHKLANKVYLVGHPMRGAEQELPDAAADDTASSLPIIKPAGLPVVVLNSIAGIRYRFERATLLESIAVKLRGDTIDLNVRLLARPEERANLFVDSTHLSRRGQLKAAEIIEDRVRIDDATLSSGNHSEFKQ